MPRRSGTKRNRAFVEEFDGLRNQLAREKEEALGRRDAEVEVTRQRAEKLFERLAAPLRVLDVARDIAAAKSEERLRRFTWFAERGEGLLWSTVDAGLWNDRLSLLVHIPFRDRGAERWAKLAATGLFRYRRGHYRHQRYGWSVCHDGPLRDHVARIAEEHLRREGLRFERAFLYFHPGDERLDVVCEGPDVVLTLAFENAVPFVEPPGAGATHAA